MVHVDIFYIKINKFRVKTQSALSQTNKKHIQVSFHNKKTVTLTSVIKTCLKEFKKNA